MHVLLRTRRTAVWAGRIKGMIQHKVVQLQKCSKQSSVKVHVGCVGQPPQGHSPVQNPAASRVASRQTSRYDDVHIQLYRRLAADCVVKHEHRMWEVQQVTTQVCASPIAIARLLQQR
jgi:hypothetical protein